MRLRNWIILEVLCGLGLGIFGYLIKNDQLFLLGSAGTMLPLFHNLIGSTFWFEHKLAKENKYAVEVMCQNCCNYSIFRIPIGKTVNETVSGRKCGYCNNEFKLQKVGDVSHD